jgi:hypothetical protein
LSLGANQIQPEERLRIGAYLHQCKTYIGFEYAVLSKNAQEEFALFAGRDGPGEGKTYDLSAGRLLLVDLSPTPPQIEQVKTEVQQIAPDKESCVRLLTDLVSKSAVAKSVLEELKRR